MATTETAIEAADYLEYEKNRPMFGAERDGRKAARDAMLDRYAKAVRGLIDENAALLAVLLDASTDIGHWVQFAKRQMAELPNVDYLPCGPTTHGIKESEGLRKRIQDVLASRTTGDPKT